MYYKYLLYIIQYIKKFILYMYNIKLSATCRYWYLVRRNLVGTFYFLFKSEIDL